ncbi:ORF142 [Ranid herpesvirus 2]|uniref:dUTP diphosphatase n=1 Tax=Ranid herpesvirus 2 TaxID=389214 RepID=Q14VW4_9VIRU|nr:ORF142 [Ranid herpesvirus 2]ABG25701.1 ORF142 [Ranid herpesvirus 2]
MLRFQRIHPKARTPSRATEHSAGYDLSPCIPTVLRANAITKVHTGIALEIPEGYYGRIVERSCMAVKDMCACGGVIDADYRGEIIILFKNNNNMDLPICDGARIAQIIFEACGRFTLQESAELTCTQRGDGAFGSTNVLK